MGKQDSSWMMGLSLGLELAVSVALFSFLGYKADGFFHTAPWFLAVGAALGGIVGFWNVYKTSDKMK